ncbi:putative acyl-CoA thioester hydrolase YkhA [Siminovitchia terrae]|uniref:Acyl-CoA thioester hydrolase YkhA n=1 Tax=Siminovitchia terrae TaxID=1914933 RepID=A0ABQ4L1M8_SIMTE|nr:acyl-CoA thioesterase [Siminovitchia terrae]GIN92184.1 putative acyl-CoA thioester hydrolase YkhA [Siminovitchia terrae]GIN98192.1 putative acyl-CoA thioester hydrolase YkhA [Siminovitchia terrae]
MEQPQSKKMKDSLTIKTSHVSPPDTNHHGNLFGGKLMSDVDDVASIAAARFARKPVVTVSTDSVDFFKPIRIGDAVTMEAIVTWSGTTSMEVFVKVLSEHLITGEKSIAAFSFLTFVALDENGRPSPVPKAIPESEEEHWLNKTAKSRAAHRQKRKKESRDLADFFSNLSL